MLFIFVLFLILLIPVVSFKATIFFSSFTAAQQNAISYLNGEEPLQGNYAPAEIAHMKDVRSLFQNVNILLVILLAAVAIQGFSLKKQKEKLQKAFLYSGIITFSAMVFILAAAFLSFNTSFIVFHQIFFPQGNWQFPGESLLIQTFPQEFFISMGIKIFSLALVFGIIFILISLFWRYVFVRKGA